MNSSLATADGATHLKIVFVALLAGILVASIGIGCRVAGGNAMSVSPRVEKPNRDPSVPPVRHPSSGKVVIV